MELEKKLYLGLDMIIRKYVRIVLKSIWDLREILLMFFLDLKQKFISFILKLY